MFTAHPNWKAVPSERFSSRKGNKVSGVVQHYTGAGDGESLARWLAGKDARVSSHILICRDGTVIQQVSLDKAAWHAGTSPKRNDFWKEEKPPTNVNSFTIGIENSNRGWLLRDEASKKFYTVRKKNGVWVPGAPYIGPDPVEAEDHRGNKKWWEPYTEQLVKANIQVLQRLVEMYPLISRDNVQHHSQVSPDRKSDPGPLWPEDFVLDSVFGSYQGDDPIFSNDIRADVISDGTEILMARRDQYDEEGEMCLLPDEDVQS